jgi:hypothetical protein
VAEILIGWEAVLHRCARAVVIKSVNTYFVFVGRMHVHDSWQYKQDSTKTIRRFRDRERSPQQPIEMSQIRGGDLEQVFLTQLNQF